MLTRREFLASLAGLSSFAITRPSLGSPARTFAVTGHVLTCEERSPLRPDHMIGVKDGQIEFITKRRTLSDRPVMDLSDAIIMPGIINAHCHSIHTSSDRRKRWLEHGVTSIGDVGAPLSALPSLANSPPGETSTTAYAGPILTPPGGYPLPVHDAHFALTISSADEGRSAVSLLADLGATMVKIAFEPGIMPTPWPMFDPPTAKAICDTAKQRGLVVRCHVEDVSGLEQALNAGVQTIEHVPHRWTDKSKPRPVLTESGEVVPDYLKLLERMVCQNVILTPTLDVFSRTPWNGPALFEPVRVFHSMGGTIALGNDFPYRRTEAGMPMQEMRLLAKAGLSNDDILRAATTHAARACQLGDRGILKPGNAADFLIVAGDPTKNLDAISSPVHIVKDGVFVR